MNVLISDVQIEIIKKDIKNMHLSVLPPDGKVRVSAPNNLSDESIIMFVKTKLGWIKSSKRNLSCNHDKVRENTFPERHYMFGDISIFCR